MKLSTASKIIFVVVICRASLAKNHGFQMLHRHNQIGRNDHTQWLPNMTSVCGSQDLPLAEEYIHKTQDRGYGCTDAMEFYPVDGSNESFIHGYVENGKVAFELFEYDWIVSVFKSQKVSTRVSATSGCYILDCFIYGQFDTTLANLSRKRENDKFCYLAIKEGVLTITDKCVETQDFYKPLPSTLPPEYKISMELTGIQSEPIPDLNFHRDSGELRWRICADPECSESLKTVQDVGTGEQILYYFYFDYVGWPPVIQHTCTEQPPIDVLTGSDTNFNLFGYDSAFFPDFYEVRNGIEQELPMQIFPDTLLMTREPDRDTHDAYGKVEVKSVRIHPATQCVVIDAYVSKYISNDPSETCFYSVVDGFFSLHRTDCIPYSGPQIPAPASAPVISLHLYKTTTNHTETPPGTKDVYLHTFVCEDEACLNPARSILLEGEFPIIYFRSLIKIPDV